MGRKVVQRGNDRRWNILARLIREYRLTDCCEVGVKSGRNIERVLAQCPKTRWIAVDPWDREMKYPARVGFWSAAQVENHEREFDALAARYKDRIRKIKAYSIAAASHVDDGSLDLVFIDALHTYDAVQEDIRLWLPKVRRGGWIGGHDYHHPRFPGVTKAVDEAFPAIEEFEDHVWLTRV